ncbi:hypothetical protein ACJMK2_014597, partial [Sinanodonta woodiana]
MDNGQNGRPIHHVTPRAELERDPGSVFVTTLIPAMMESIALEAALKYRHVLRGHVLRQ